MDDETSDAPPSTERPESPWLRWLPAAVPAGVVLAVAGVVVGLVMAMRRREISCPDGTYFPQGETDFRCFSHPQALDGTAVIILSLMLGILIVVSGEIARSVVNNHRAEDL